MLIYVSYFPVPAMFSGPRSVTEYHNYCGIKAFKGSCYEVSDVL